MKKQLVTLLFTFIFCLTAVAPGFAANVNIPACFSAYNEYNKTRDIADLNKNYALIPEENRADKCIKCGMCLSSCKFGAIVKK